MKKDTENNSVSFLFGECNVTIFAPGKNIGCFLRCEEESYCIGVRYIGAGDCRIYDDGYFVLCGY